MRLLIINATCGIGSTGRIATDIAKEYEASGYEVKIAYGRGNVPKECDKYAVRIGSDRDTTENFKDVLLSDNEGFGAKHTTEEFLAWTDEYNPDFLWLHNLHGYYLNVEKLFAWIKTKRNLKVYWTLHDCWAFTGHCAYFTYNNCYKWENGCKACDFYYQYPSSSVDNSEMNYKRKRDTFTGVEDLTIITPSKWLKDLVSRSFLKEYKSEIIHNKVDGLTFKHTESDFRARYGLMDKKIVLGVANVWSERKGLDDFCRLAKMLTDDYQIVLVGLSPKQVESIPEGIISIPRTESKEELAKIYSAADVFLNPSKEEVFGMTTLEALSCGTKAIVIKGTASEEVANANGGIAIEDDVELMLKKIKELTK